MDISRHLNLIRNHGYKGKIGVVKETINGIVLAAARPGDVVLFRPYKVREDECEEAQEYDRTHCSIEFLQRGTDSEEQIEYDVLVIDSCEYILVQSDTYMNYHVNCITHKGNCKFCKERER